jgi:CheY-like chemotaxis protein
MSAPGSKHKILIVDDEPANIRVMGALLKDDYQLIIPVFQYRAACGGVIPFSMPLK